MNGYGGTYLAGNLGPSFVTYLSQTASVTMSKFISHHTVKAGVEYRRMGADVLTYGASAGDMGFTAGFTQGPNANTASTAAGDAFASFLLGYPATGTTAVAGQGNYFLNYYSGYVQDDFRVTSKLTLNVGLRYEFEDGLRERDNRFTVGFDPAATFPVQVRGHRPQGRSDVCRDRTAIRPIRASPYKGQLAPRGGIAWSLTDKTVVRGGYGLFWAPTQFPGVDRSHRRCAWLFGVHQLSREQRRRPDACRYASATRSRAASPSRRAIRSACSPAPAARSTSSTRTRSPATCSSTRSTTNGSSRPATSSASDTWAAGPSG